MRSRILGVAALAAMIVVAVVSASPAGAQTTVKKTGNDVMRRFVRSGEKSYVGPRAQNLIHVQGFAQD